MEINVKEKQLHERNELVYDPKRILLFVDSEEINHRLKALDVLCQYLKDIYSNGLTNDPDEDNLLKISITFAILTRCDDISPEIRIKAVTVFYQVAEFILKFLDEIKDEQIINVDTDVDVNELELEVNGEHRFFWYCMTSFEERQRELMAVIHRRMDDNNMSVRKQAILVLEKLLISDSTYVIKKNLKSLKCSFNDSKCLVRKQSILSLSRILKAYQDNSEIQELWLTCILPLVNDPVDIVQSAALTFLEELFLFGIFSGSGDSLSIALLKKLTTGCFLVYQKFLRKAFSIWKVQDKLRPGCADDLINYAGTENEEFMWFYLSLISEYCTISLEFSYLCIQNLSNSLQTGEYPAVIEYLLKTLMHLLDELPEQIIETVYRITRNGLASFSVPVAFIPMYIEVLLKVCKLTGFTLDLEKFLESMVQDCESYLSDVKSRVSCDLPAPEDDVLARRFITLTECFLLFPSLITPRLIGLLKYFAGCVENPVTFSSNIKAHAFVALGKTCLQDEVLARELLRMFAEELLTSKQDVIRCNACVILIDMCKRYPFLTDACIPLISTCFKDNVYLIRYQAIVQVINLFQNDYIKWKSPLFFGFLSALTDKKGVIRELGYYALDHFLPDYERQLFLEHFVDSIFVLNRFSPPDNKNIAQSVKKLRKFSAAGENRRGKRMIVYRFLLEHMDINEKVKAIEFVCGILTNIAESVYDLNSRIECIMRDCFSILGCDEIKTINLDSIENMDEPLENELSRIETMVRRTILIDPVVKVTIGLISIIKNPNSDLIYDIIVFLKDLLNDYKDDIEDIISQDKILLKQLQLEYRTDEAKKRRAIKIKKDLLTGRNNKA